MIVKELVARLGFTTDQASLARAEAGFKRLRTSLLQVTAIAAGVGGAIFATAKSAATYADNVVKSAQKTGLATDAYQRLAYNASLANVEQEKMSMSLIFLSRLMGEAVKGNQTAIDNLKEAGVTLKDLKDPAFTAEKAIEKIADKVQGMGLGFKTTAMAAQVLGARTGAALIPMLIDGAKGMRTLSKEAEDLGLIFGEAALNQGPRFNDNMDRVTRVVGAFKNMIGLELLPMMSDIMDEFLAWVKANREMIKVKAKEWAEGLVKAFKALYGAAKRIVVIIEAVTDRFGGIEKTARLAAWAIGLMYAANIAMGLGNLIVGLAGVVTSLQKIKSIAILANAAILGIGAGWLLIIDTLVRGQDSELAKFGRRLQEIFPPYRKFVEWLAGLVVEFQMFDFSGAWTSLKESFSDVIDWMKGLWGDLKTWIIDTLWDMVKLIPGVGAFAYGIDLVKKLQKDTTKAAPQVLKAAENAEALSGTKLTGPFPQGSTTNNDIDNHVRIEVKVESGASAIDIAEAVRDEVEGVLDRSVRSGLRAVEGGAT